MKKIPYKIYVFIGLILFSLHGFSQNFQPINVNTTPVNSSCSAQGGGFAISAPTEVLSGDNIPLNITLPGTLDPGCDVTITINYSSPNNKLQYVTSSNIGFTASGSTLTSTALPGNDGQNFNVFFKFPNHLTCNGEVGTLSVTFDACGESCTTSVNVTARAANYWTVQKEFVIGDLTCGTSQWRIKVLNNNPNPSGYGNYKIQGTVMENTSLPVLSNAVQNVIGYTGDAANYIVTLQNCQNDGTIITNTIDYNFTLGDSCDSMQGSVSADSPPLQSPNASLNFTKTLETTSGSFNFGTGMFEMSAGCSAKYTIRIYNDGNTPWQINSITDTIPSGITIDSVVPNGFTMSQTGSQYTFNNGPILNPGETQFINFYFTINSATSGIITNTAYIDYNAPGGGTTGSGSGTQCAGVNCPQIDASIQNDDDSISIEVVEAFPREIFKKCVTNQSVGNIYNIGDTVHFRYVLGNSGSGDLSTTINDAMGLPNQNLQIVPSSINYAYFEDNYYNTGNWLCGATFQNQQPVNFPVTVDTSDLQNPVFNIANLPGICQYYRANYLVIEFDALILSQIYGSKTNTAHTTHNQSSASYTIDQIGVLEVNKRADQEFVENGATFNYIIELTNSGSVPLDNVTISDQIPSCVHIGQQMTATDFAGNPISVTSSGNLAINFPSSWQLMPGETATITIPATKNGGGTCCNESVTAQGTMITSGVVLEANYGTEDEPAACVKSTECCEIPDFEAHLYENNDGTYSVALNGGSTPIQQVDISVVDYHVEYNQRDCQPQDMGIFGNLSTQAQNLNGLVLDNATNNTTNLTWLPGNPAMLTNSVDFTISKPNVLNLACCKADFYFCIKVSVKDVNCNVCEKVICVEKKPDEHPCQIDVKNMQDVYCTNDTISISWTGANTSGVNVYIKPATGGSPTMIAQNQPATGNINWTIPSNMKPCDKDWVIIVADTANPDECNDSSNTFTIKCCEQACECGNWQSETIIYSEKLIATPHTGNISSSIKRNTLKWKQYETTCGGVITINTGVNYVFEAPEYHCNPATCDPEYSWIITNNSGGASGVTPGEAINLQFNNPGIYTIEIAPSCNGNDCDKCTFTIRVEGKNVHPISPSPTGRLMAPGTGIGNGGATNAQDWNSSRSNKTSKTS